MKASDSADYIHEDCSFLLSSVHRLMSAAEHCHATLVTSASFSVRCPKSSLGNLRVVDAGAVGEEPWKKNWTKRKKTK